MIVLIWKRETFLSAQINRPQISARLRIKNALLAKILDLLQAFGKWREIDVSSLTAKVNQNEGFRK